MTSTLQIRKYLDIKLTGNDINIIDMIMDYITIKCDGCKDKVLISNINEVECNCSANTPLDKCKQDYNFCDTCLDEQCCNGCYNYYCPLNDDDSLRECGDENCNTKWCDNDCFNTEMLFCSQCEDWFCCRGIRRYIGNDLEYMYICDVCNKPENCEYYHARH